LFWRQASCDLELDALLDVELELLIELTIDTVTLKQAPQPKKQPTNPSRLEHRSYLGEAYNLRDGAGEAFPIRGFERNNLEDEKVQRALDEVGRSRHEPSVTEG